MVLWYEPLWMTDVANQGGLFSCLLACWCIVWVGMFYASSRRAGLTLVLFTTRWPQPFLFIAAPVETCVITSLGLPCWYMALVGLSHNT